MKTPMLRRINDNVARGEAAMAMAMLLLMLVVAFAQAALRNLTQAGFTWANSALAFLDWGDFVLQKGTLWLAFIGASLAVHAEKHVAIDIVPRFMNPRGRILLRGLVGIAGCVICYLLAKAFYEAISVNGLERPSDVEVFASDGNVHICDASPAQLAEVGVSRGPFCLVRGFLKVFGVVMETPGAAFQLIVPVMLGVMSLRTLGNGIYQLIRFGRGDTEDDASGHGLPGVASEVAHDIDDHGGAP